jgi:aspartyl/asparaginyl beta-hydroxylase (cupin superfamily)
VQFVLLPSDMLFTNIKRAAGAVDNARPDRWGEKVIRFVGQPECLSRAASPLPVLADAQHLSEVASSNTLTTWL